MEPRRENGITVRYLAQTIINEAVFPDGEGIDLFVKNIAKPNGRKTSETTTLIEEHGADKSHDFSGLKYYFFLHLEDYGIGDKSEIDLVLWNDKVILPVEIKAFTDANSTGVKREIVRNYLHVKAIRDRGQFKFNTRQEIYPVLLYSEAFQTEKRNGDRFDYFNENYLLKMARHQKNDILTWRKGDYSVPDQYAGEGNFANTVKEINSRLFFITWDDVAMIHRDLNTDGRLSSAMDQLYAVKDIDTTARSGDRNGCPLVTPATDTD